MAHLLAVFLVSFTFYQTIHSLPILSGSGAIPENGIDCSQAPSSKMDLSEIESGLFVIEKYIHLQYLQVSPVTLNRIIVIALHIVNNIDIFLLFFRYIHIIMFVRTSHQFPTKNIPQNIYLLLTHLNI